MEKIIVRLLVPAAFLAFAFQFWVVSEYGEPYPALMLPSFGGSARSGPQSHEKPTVLFLREETVCSENPLEDLFPGLPSSQQQIIGRNRLHHRSKMPVGEKVREWARSRADALGCSGADTLIIRWHRHTLSEKEEPPKWVGDFTIPL